MNENLQERFGRSRPGTNMRPTAHAEVWLQPSRLNYRIREYFQQTPAHTSYWRSRPEIPTSAEVMDQDANGQSTSDVVEIAPNKPVGAWVDNEDYLSTQYELLREDSVRPLRDALFQIRRAPTAGEDNFNGQIGIYEKVHVCAVTLSFRGVATRVTFSLRRTGKQILWEQSKRLISGSLVALSPVEDMFKTKAIVATVAARPLSGLQQNPPEIDLFFAQPEDMEIDPATEFVMVEARSGYFESSRHTLLGLQHMAMEPFPLSEHLVGVQPEVSAPQYVLANPNRDLRPVLTDNKNETYENVDILKSWPRQPQSDLDASQLAALRSMLARRLAIIQGPPGTGKTHVSVKAIEVMLGNRNADDPPIIVACQTNHAIDQILRHVAQFEPEFVRLGGRSKDKDVIKKRTLYEVRKLTSENPPPGWMGAMAKKNMIGMQKLFAMILGPLEPNKKPIDHRQLESLGLLTKLQADSLEAGASQWVQTQMSNPNEARSPFTLWLGDKLVLVPPKQQAEDFGFEFEETDLEFEQLKEIEAENMAKDDEEFEALPGLTLPLADNFTCRKMFGLGNIQAESALKEQNMWAIPEAVRGAVYRYLQSKLKAAILNAFREQSKKHNDEAKKQRIGFWEKDENILKSQKVIGMTTSGFSKYRALICALQPRVVLIEEAGETMEAPVTVACVPSLQQLLLVGDHQQLRPHTQVRAHEGEPYHLNMSLFERLVNNNVQRDLLTQQRRMIPEIRRLLYPIYADKLTDHPLMLDPVHRPDVPGMGGINSFFFAHRWDEQRDEQMSCFNPTEAKMIVGFVEYLACNGVDMEDITILTFYNGQRKRILWQLRQRELLEGNKFNVVTVDSYQGEENKVVILSLVRSNASGQIGFLDVKNRVCVALSRAQCGFYVFGNGELLHKASQTWKDILEIFAGRRIKQQRPTLEPKRIYQDLPIRCSNHDNASRISCPDDWDKIDGGCNNPCCEQLPCGHPCPLRCHPIPHELVNCQKCPLRPLFLTPLECSYEMSDTTDPARAPSPVLYHSDSVHTTASSDSTNESWNSFASQSHKRATDSTVPCVTSLQRSLVDFQNELRDLTRKTEKIGIGLHDGVPDVSSAESKSVTSDATRNKWKDTYVVENEAPFEDWSRRESLLD